METAEVDSSVQMGQPGCLPLPVYLLEDILNRVEDAKDIAKAQCVCKEFWIAGNNVRSLRFIVLDEYHERARNIMGSVRSGIPSRCLRWRRIQELRQMEENRVPLYDGGASKSSQDRQDGSRSLNFKDEMVKFLEKRGSIEQLRVETESQLQAKAVSAGEKRRTDFWISDPRFWRQCLPQMGLTLQHLSIVDYGQQAIIRQSNIIQILSQSCKRLKTLDLANMFIGTNDCEQMPLMTSLTLRTVKVTGGALQDINDVMPKLQTLALLQVFDVERGTLTFQEMKVLCLGLSTSAKEVELNLPKLEKLQLKLQCPQKLIIKAPVLKYIAFNLEVMEPSQVELKCIAGLQELLYGASSFITLASIIDKKPNLKRVFLDIPCMALGEDGRFLGVLKDVPLTLPDFSRLHECGTLEVLAIGPGLWHSMETNVETLASVETWPSMHLLIPHMMPRKCDSAIRVLQMSQRFPEEFSTIYFHDISAKKIDKFISAAVSGPSQGLEVDFFELCSSCTAPALVSRTMYGGKIIRSPFI